MTGQTEGAHPMKHPEFWYRKTERYHLLKKIADANDDTPCYIPGIGETTLGSVKLAARGDVFSDAFAQSLQDESDAVERRRRRWAGEHLP